MSQRGQRCHQPHICRIPQQTFWHATRSDVSPDEIPQWAIQVTAIVAVSMITFVCVIARNLGTRIAVVFTSVKVRVLSILGLVTLTILFS